MRSGGMKGKVKVKRKKSHDVLGLEVLAKGGSKL
jgi:hypothetical protein